MAEREYILYRITNTVNDKIYIGQTMCGLKRRFDQHKDASRTGKKSKLYNAMRKYGVENFRIERLATVDNIDTLNDLERHCIMKLQTYKNGYNIYLGGDNSIREDRHGFLTGEKGVISEIYTKLRHANPVLKLRMCFMILNLLNHLPDLPIEDDGEKVSISEEEKEDCLRRVNAVMAGTDNDKKYNVLMVLLKYYAMTKDFSSDIVLN